MSPEPLPGVPDEEWADVRGAEGRAWVSDQGRSWVGNGPGVLWKGGGYPRLKIAPGRLRALHIVVTEAFHGPRPEGAFACHRDDDKTNTSARNLYWGTRTMNAQDFWRNKAASRAGMSWFTMAELRRRGWNEWSIRGRLGEPDVVVGEVDQLRPFYGYGSKLYARDRVLEAEQLRRRSAS